MSYIEISLFSLTAKFRSSLKKEPLHQNSHVVILLIALYLATSGIRAASVLGNGALESDYDPQVLSNICNQRSFFGWVLLAVK